MRSRNNEEDIDEEDYVENERIADKPCAGLAFVACEGPAGPGGSGDSGGPGGPGGPGDTLQSISISSGPAKTVYAQGDALDLDGLVVQGIYSVSGTVPVSGYTLSWEGPLVNGNTAITAAAGTKTITVTWGARPPVLPLPLMMANPPGPASIPRGIIRTAAM
jgi:hypothetical protein